MENNNLSNARRWWNSLITEEQVYKKALMLKEAGVSSENMNLTEATDEEVIRLYERTLNHTDKMQSSLLYYENDEVLVGNIEAMKLGTEHPKYKIGQVIEFTGGYYNQFRYRTKITGFDKNGDIYILWDSYWFPIRDEASRDIKIIE